MRGKKKNGAARKQSHVGSDSEVSVATQETTESEALSPSRGKKSSRKKAGLDTPDCSKLPAQGSFHAAVEQLVDSKANKAAACVKRILGLLQQSCDPDAVSECYDTVCWQMLSFMKKASAADAVMALTCIGAVLLLVGRDGVSLSVYEDIEKGIHNLVRTTKADKVKSAAVQLFGLLAFLGCDDDLKLDEATQWFESAATSSFRLAPPKCVGASRTRTDCETDWSTVSTFPNNNRLGYSDDDDDEECVRRMCSTPGLSEEMGQGDDGSLSPSYYDPAVLGGLSCDASLGSVTTATGTNVDANSPSYRRSHSQDGDDGPSLLDPPLPADVATRAEGFIVGWTLLATRWGRRSMADVTACPGHELFSYVSLALERATRSQHSATESAATTAALMIEAMWRLKRVASEEDLMREGATRNVLSSLRILSGQKFTDRTLSSRGLGTGTEDKKTTATFRALLGLAETGVSKSTSKQLDSSKSRVLELDPSSQFEYTVFKGYLKGSLVSHIERGSGGLCELLVSDCPDSGTAWASSSVKHVDKSLYSTSEKARNRDRNWQRSRKSNCLWGEDDED